MAMEENGRNRGRESSTRRTEVLKRKRTVQGVIKLASSVNDHLTKFQNLCRYQRNGLHVHLVSGRGNKLSAPAKHYIQDLLKLNMEAPYGPEWSAQEKIKRREMVAVEAHYIFVHEISNDDASEVSVIKDNKGTSIGHGSIVGFVHYRFILEEEVPVIYVYELQLEPCVQGKGLGKFLMQLIELIACENKMGAVVLTVQRANLSAMNFYIGKLRYVVSAISPSKVDPQLGIEKSYEILCRTFDNEAKLALEVRY